MTITPRWRSWAGVAGPVAFITAWATLGATRDGYSTVQDPISRLAAVGSPTRPAMTAGFVVFAAGVGAYSAALRDRDLRGAASAATLNAAAALGVAALPLGGPGGDRPHAFAASIAYAALGATPLLAARPLAQRGERLAAAASIAAGVTVATAHRERRSPAKRRTRTARRADRWRRVDHRLGTPCPPRPRRASSPGQRAGADRQVAIQTERLTGPCSSSLGRCVWQTIAVRTPWS